MADTAAAASHGNTVKHTKPEEWAQFMVAAALRLALDKVILETSYATADEAQADILKTLNRYEAQSQYEWPNFMLLGFNFNQAMDFRRDLVNDVFVALHKADKVCITGKPREPDDDPVIAARKRKFKVYAELPYHMERLEDGNISASIYRDQILMDAMCDLLGRSGFKAQDHLYGVSPAHELASFVHDGLVDGWNGIQTKNIDVPRELFVKQTIWNCYKDIRAELFPGLEDAIDQAESEYYAARRGMHRGRGRGRGGRGYRGSN